MLGSFNSLFLAMFSICIDLQQQSNAYVHAT